MANQTNVNIDESNISKDEEQDLSSSDNNKPKRHVGRIIFRVVIIVLVVLIVVCIGGFSIYRWLWGSDSFDIQGSWYIDGTDIPVEITEDHIVLNDEVSYFYEINSESKTITYNLGDLEGGGCYRFSIDRNQIAIMDGNFNWWTTLFSDIPWTVDAFVSFVGGQVKSPAGDRDVTLLTRNEFVLSEENLSEENNLEDQGDNSKDNAALDGEDVEGDSDSDNTSERDKADLSDDSVGQNEQSGQDDQIDLQEQGEQSNTDSSGETDHFEEFNMFGMYDR